MKRKQFTLFFSFNGNFFRDPILTLWVLFHEAVCASLGVLPSRCASRGYCMHLAEIHTIPNLNWWSQLFTVPITPYYNPTTKLPPQRWTLVPTLPCTVWWHPSRYTYRFLSSPCNFWVFFLPLALLKSLHVSTLSTIIHYHSSLCPITNNPHHYHDSFLPIVQHRIPSVWF